MTERVKRLLEDLGSAKGQCLEFFIFFSRFEYALKSSGFLRSAGQNAEPDWREFAKAIDCAFLRKVSEQEHLTRAVDYLRNYAPKKQVVDKGTHGAKPRLTWKGITVPQDTSGLLVLVRRVRNNLFHGGKFCGGHLKDAARDAKLLSNSVVILEACLATCSSVKKCFDRRL